MHVHKFVTSSFLVLLLSSPMLAIACGSSSEKPQKPDRSWVKNDTVIYGASGKGQIFRTRFDSNKIEILTDHHLNSIDDMEVSPDKRYLLYSGEKNQKMMRSYYVYDTKTGRESYIPPPKAGYYFPNISPDSSQILLENTYVDIDTLEVYNINDRTKSEIPFPATEKDKILRLLEPEWSDSGRYIYIAFLIKPRGELFYKYNLADGSYKKISGKSDSAGNHFIENGHEVNIPHTGWIGSMKGGYRIATSDASYIAYVDKDNNLMIENKSGSITLVQNGEYSQCEGISVVPIVWLKGKANYLLYRSHGLIYIYGVKEKHKSPLFDRSVEFFDWNNRQ